MHMHYSSMIGLYYFVWLALCVVRLQRLVFLTLEAKICVNQSQCNEVFVCLTILLNPIRVCVCVGR